MRVLIYIFLALTLLLLAASIYVRVSPVDPNVWHVDPEEVTPPTTPNFALLAGPQAVAIDVPTLVIAGRLQEVVEADGAEVLAGSLGEGFVTYVIRSRIMGFPDFVTVKLVSEGEETRLHIFSRSRDGYSDMGVNTARVQRWLTAARDELEAQ